MATYLVSVVATSNSTSNTEDTFIQLTAAASTQCSIRRVRVFYRGDTTAVGDNNVECRVVIQSAAGTGGVAGTAVKTNPLMPAATSTVDVKSGTTAYSVGTVTNTFTNFAFNERGFYEWVALDDKERYASGSAGILSVLLKSSAASRQYAVECEFEE